MDKVKTIPELRFNEFSECWQETIIGDLGEILGGGTPPTSKTDFWKGTIPWVSSSDLGDENIRYIRKSRFISKEAIKKSATKLVPAKSILIVSRVGVGKVAINETPICTSQDFQSLVPSKDNHVFLAYLIQLKTKQLIEFNQGTSIKGFVKSELANFKLKIPTLPEQQKIAAFLTAVDEKIQQLSKKKTQLEQYKKGLMQQIFSREIRFKDELGNEYLDWEHKKLGELGDTFNGLTGKTKENFGIGYPYITYKQIFDNSVIDVSKFELVDVGGNESQNLVKFGDVFFTTSSETANEIGYASVLLDEVETVYLNSFCFGYRIHSFESLSPYYARYLFRSSQFRMDIQKLAQGSTRYNMSKVGLMKLSIILPPIEEQSKIANFLSAIDDKINLVSRQLKQTRQYKKGLLQQMFV